MLHPIWEPTINGGKIFDYFQTFFFPPSLSNTRFILRTSRFMDLIVETAASVGTRKIFIF